MKKQKAGKTAAGKKNIFLLLLVVGVVAVSGCISLGNIFGSSTTTVEASSDVMAVSDSTVIPNPPILTGDTFTASFAMKNLDEFEDAKNVKLELYDWGVCTPSSCTPAKSGEIGWDAIDKNKLQTSYSASFGAVSPKDVQQVECQFRAPPSEKIGGIDARCPIRYKLTYDFSGITTTELNVISNKKFQEMSRAGQTPTVTSVQSKSRGPIKVDFSFGVNQPVRTSIIDTADTSKNNIVKIPMYIRIENKGSGKIPTGEINKITKLVINGKDYNNVGVGDEFETINKIIVKIKSIIKSSAVSEGSAVFLIYNNKKEKISEFSLSPGNANANYFVNLNGKIISDESKIDVSIKLPKELDGDCAALTCDDYFTPSLQGDNCVLSLKTDNKIDFVKDKSQVFRCELTSPDEDKYKQEHNNQDFEQKTYSIQSEVKYTYQIDNDFNVAIRPMVFG